MNAARINAPARNDSDEGSPRVLIVDDDSSFVAAMSRRLRKRYSVRCAHNADDALRIIEHEPAFAVVISDLHMPEVDGVSLMSVLREKAPATTRILLTGTCVAAAAIDAVNRGNVFRYLNKPCKDDVLFTAMDAAVQEHRRHNEHERLASHMVSSFQHEFRTPLQHIIGFASFLENGGAPAGAIREYARYIRESGESLVSMTDVLLTLAALREGRRELHADDVKSRALFSALRTRHREEAADRRQELVFSSQNSASVIHVDFALMLMALSALISNAVKFTPMGGRIEVVCRRRDGRTILEVLDTGPGVEPEDIENILRPFAQADIGLARRFEGVGLGLPLAKAAAELHDGALVLGPSSDGRFSAQITFPDHSGCGSGHVEQQQNVARIATPLLVKCA